MADLANQAEPGRGCAFRDRVGSFDVRAEGRALLLTGDFPRATVWRFDLSTFDGQVDMGRLYVPHGFAARPDPDAIHTRRVGTLLGDPAKGLTHTGPWDVFGGAWMTGTARVAIDGQHVYTLWFDLPSLEDQAAGRLYGSFALDIARPGRHTVRIAFEDFERHTRWRPSRRRPERPPREVVPNPLRPHHIGSIAIGEDERVAALERVTLKPELVGRHPRLSGTLTPLEHTNPLGLDDPAVQKLIAHLDPDLGELWEYSDDAESMASGNDMDTGRKGLAGCETYDRLLPRLTPDARKAVERAFLKRFRGIYTFWVFQRNYLPTGYAQNHSSKAVWALLGAGLAWDGPEAQRWLDWAVMTCRKRVALLGRDGGLEWMNESRAYGHGFWLTSQRLILQCTGVDLARGPFFENEWRYALHNAPAFPADRVPLSITQHGTRPGANPTLPAEVTDSTPTDVHFDDVDQVFMRSGWGEDDFRLRFLAGSVFGKAGTPRAIRYNWAHCQVNRGSIHIAKGIYPIIDEPGLTRTYRKGAGNNNCILVNGTDQWGGGQCWHPRLRLDQVGRIAFFADGALLSVARADLAAAYPPEAKVKTLSRVVVHLKPDHFLVFDRLETEGRGSAEWRYHAAFVEPMSPSDRFRAFGWAPQPGRNHPSYEAAFRKVEDATCEVAFLSPKVRAEVGMSDVYFRGTPFRRPTRRLRVVQEGDGPLTLLAAFAPKVQLQRRGEGVFSGRSGGRTWTLVLGRGRADALQSDARFAVAVQTEGDRAEVYRFGGRNVSLDGAAVPSEGEDGFVSRGAGPK